MNTLILHLPLLVLVAIAAGIDWRTRRIPNWLNLMTLLIGFGLSLQGTIPVSPAMSLLGIVVGLILLLPGFALNALGGGNWAEGFIIAGAVGLGLGFVNAFLVWRLNIISIVATISTFNIFFGLLMFFTKGVSIYDLPEWLSTRVVFYEREMSDGSWVELTLPDPKAAAKGTK